LIIATADFLALHGKFDHAGELLKADLRQGIVVKPWVYQSLAVALRESNGSPEEIERAEMSVADLEPLDAQGFLQAARALAHDKHYNQALAFCRQAALLEPNVPYPYRDALGYAELARDSKAMEWAAGALLQQDWPVNNQELRDKAIQKLEALARALEKAGRTEEGQRLRDVAAARQRRDLVIKLVWQGEADLDLKVQEPTGSTCWVLNRQTVGGGTLIGNSLTDTSETYLAAQAFPGEYQISVERIWGRTLGDKAQIRVIRHQGTRNQTEKLYTVWVKSNKSEPIKIALEGGRRTQAASVPPPSSVEPPDPPPRGSFQ